MKAKTFGFVVVSKRAQTDHKLCKEELLSSKEEVETVVLNWRYEFCDHY